NNIVYNCGGNAFVYYDTDSGVDFCYNTTYDNGAHANYQDTRRAHTNEWAGFEHNPRQAGSNNRSGEIVYNTGDDIELRNNVCIAGDNPDTGWTGGKAVLTDWYATTVTVDNNAFHSEENYWNDRVSSPGTNPVLGSGWNTAPDLEDYAGYDFRPSTGGNLDGAGAVLDYVTTDIYGVTRHATTPTPGAIETTV
ncbi:MAG: hypothetical protein GY932_08695, partial [Arcobacter sp.]|nr:hypothetical protein [Arcobacter sp.]